VRRNHKRGRSSPAEHAPDRVVDHRDHAAGERHRSLARFALVDRENDVIRKNGLSRLPLFIRAFTKPLARS
jgi:hypothetical protein